MTGKFERAFIFWVLILIGCAISIDVIGDLKSGSPMTHVYVELALAPLALIGATLMGRRYIKMKAELERFRLEATKHIEGLLKTIQTQFEIWKLSAAEQEIALLLIKGMSHKEVAEIRGTSERSARQQALSIYQKSGVSGRAELAAYFLEDLLD